MTNVVGNMKYKCFNIDYCVEYQDIYMELDKKYGEYNYGDEEINKEIKLVKDSLPKEVILDVDTEDCESEDEIQDMIVNALSEKTFWLINSYEYKAI